MANDRPDDSLLFTTVSTEFKLPIEYNAQKQTVRDNIITDLELIHNTPDGNAANANTNGVEDDVKPRPLYTYCFDNTTNVSLQINKQMVKTYTTDTAFLTETQLLLKTYKPLDVTYTNYSSNYEKLVEVWNEFNSKDFQEKYYYVEWEMLSFLNRSETFLQFMCIYNMLSPVMSLLVPVFILIIPFFIIKMKGLTITIQEYVDILKRLASQNAIGRLFCVNLSENSMQDNVWLFMSAGFYVYSIYQNIMVCRQFNRNMQKIHTYLHELKIYLQYAIERATHFLETAKSYETYLPFCDALRANVTALEDIKRRIEPISEFNLFNVSQAKMVGYVFKCFYELHKDPWHKNAIAYSMGFHGYLDCITGLQKNLAEGKMHFASALDGKKPNVIKGNYYACLKEEKPIKNTVRLNKNIIITGPNASGKTTVLKSVLLNVLLTQQFGCGFYDDARMIPYAHLHCYLNIPDTSGRDSLFQAEARRCKEILNSVMYPANSDATHLCVFDELYSGTNPEEAERSASAFLKFLAKYHNRVTFLLTTHFVKICKTKNKYIVNCMMETTVDKDRDALVYTYRLRKGVSKVKGGLLVLKQMNFPAEITMEEVHTQANDGA